MFSLTLHKTYYKQGFFNVTVDFDHAVRKDDGPVTITLAGEVEPIQAKVNRHANQNGTARIMGGVPLRDWFQKNFHEMDTLKVEFLTPTSLEMSLYTEP